MSPQDPSPFRDPVLGAEWFRRDLLRDRRDDLAEMPAALRAVTVARWGRLGAGAGAALVGALAVGLAMWARAAGDVPSWVIELFPGDVPAVLSTLVFGSWLAALVGGLCGQRVGERIFRREMARCVLPTADAVADVDRLERESPNEAALRLALGVEGTSAAVAVAGLALVAPAAALVAREAIAAAGYPRIDPLEAALVTHAPLLAAAAGFGAAAALWTRRTLRRSATGRLGRRVRQAAAVALGAGLALAALGGAGEAMAVAVGLGAAALVLARVRSERVRIGLGDSDAAALDAPVGRAVRDLAARIAAPLSRAGRRARALAAAALAPLAGRRRAVWVAALALTGVAAGFVTGFAVHATGRSPLPATAAAAAVTVAASADEPAPGPDPAAAVDAPATQPTAAGCVCPPPSH